MKQILNRLFVWIEGRVDPFGPYPEQTPDKRPLHFMLSHLRPFSTVMWIGGVLGGLVAVLELGLIWYAGRLVDQMAAGPGTFFSDHGIELVLAAVVLLMLRPLVVGLNAIVLFSGISTNMLTQARWRSHRHMLGQPVGFFQNDFAGRLSNRVLNMGYAVEAVRGLLAGGGIRDCDPDSTDRHGLAACPAACPLDRVVCRLCSVAGPACRDGIGKEQPCQFSDHRPCCGQLHQHGNRQTFRPCRGRCCRTRS